jgi:hypothetical protein
VKEGGSYLQRETSASDFEDEEGKAEGSLEEGSEHARQKPVAISK